MIKKEKEVEDSKLYIKELAEEWTDENGKVHKEYIWRLADKDVNLGSLKKPKKGIVGFKYEVPSDEVKRGSIFKGFFPGS